MSIILYDETHPHPGGFIGYRVARTIGHEGDYRQRYFSAKIYGSDAKRMAHALDQKWAQVAQKYKKRHATELSPTSAEKAHIFAPGFRLFIASSRRRRGNEFRTYLNMGYRIERPEAESGVKITTVHLSEYFELDWLIAVDLYATGRKISRAQKTELMLEIPSRGLIIHHLRRVEPKYRDAYGWSLLKQRVLAALKNHPDCLK